MDFEIVASRWREIEEKSSVLEMTGILASLLKETPPGEVEWVVYLCQCQVAPPYKGVDLGVGEKLLMNAIAKATGYQRAEIEKMFTDSGDLGLVAEKLVGGRRQRPLFSERLSVKKVYETLYKIAASSGEGSQNAKVNGVVELLNAATPLEARYLARLPTGELRLGIRDPTILNALSLIASGTKELREEIEDKYNIHPDLGEIAREFLSKGAGALKKISIELGVPIRPALCERLSSAEEILEKMNGKTAVDSKYDGFRLQVHKKGSKVMLFSRQMEDMTAMFPDVVAGVLAQVKARDCVLDCEALAFDAKTSQFFPFQTTMQRRRKHGIDAMA
ncbi:MAG TPA: ATP-dependent DNA ligase, partial [archaeon]|nr:ATP-dependent DNA ligase [archaeon]